MKDTRMGGVLCPHNNTVEQQVEEVGGAIPTPRGVPPLPQRRPRVREVSSRFMSSSCTPGGDLSVKHQATSPEFQARQRSKQEQETTLCCADENIRLDTPLGSHNRAAAVPRKQQRAVVKLLYTGKSSSRPDTPTGADRIIPSRFRQNSKCFQRPTATAAAKLFQSSGLSLSAQPSSDLMDTSISLEDPPPCSDKKSVPPLSGSDSWCTAATIQRSSRCPNSIQNSSSRTPGSVPDIMRSSMPEETTRLLGERNCSSSSHAHFSKFSASPCSRSLNLLPLTTGCEQHSFHSLKTGERPTPPSTSRMGSLCLPPHPTCIKLGAAADARKGRKVFAHQDNVHSLKLLHNHHLQWRYANAKAEASALAQTNETERKLYSLGVKVSDLRDVVKRKRIEFGLLQRTKTLSTICEAHMPYLEKWSALEEEYSTSLSGVIHALVNSLLRLPISADVQFDIRDVGEALTSAKKMMEMIGLHVQSFMPKAEEMDTLISELARVIGGEKALIEECGDMLFKTYKSQVEDCSLRGHIMQLQRTNQFQMHDK